MLNFIDDIYRALYGTAWSGRDELYSEYYDFESKGMWSDIVEKTTNLIESKFEIDSTDVAKIIYLAEEECIGNNKNNCNLYELTSVAKKILRYIELMEGEL